MFRAIFLGSNLQRHFFWKIPTVTSNDGVRVSTQKHTHPYWGEVNEKLVVLGTLSSKQFLGAVQFFFFWGIHGGKLGFWASALRNLRRWWLLGNALNQGRFVGTQLPTTGVSLVCFRCPRHLLFVIGVYSLTCGFVPRLCCKVVILPYFQPRSGGGRRGGWMFFWLGVRKLWKRFWRRFFLRWWFQGS